MTRKGYSRLSKRLETQSKRNLILTILGMLVVVFIMIRFGIPFLADFTGFISGFSKANKETQKKNSGFVSAPILDPIPNATNNPELIVKGQALENQSVAIYLNDALLDEKNTEKDGSFSFKIFLHEGENKIKTLAMQEDKKSDFSEEEIIKLLKKSPPLDLKTPSDGQKFEKDQSTVTVTGSTDADIKVTVNDFWAQMEGSNFSYTLILQNGDNNIKIVATDEAGNKTEKSIKVIYSP